MTSPQPTAPSGIVLVDIEDTRFDAEVRWDGYDIDNDPLVALWTAFPKDGVYSGLPIKSMEIATLPPKTSIRVEIES